MARKIIVAGLIILIGISAYIKEKEPKKQEIPPMPQAQKQELQQIQEQDYKQGRQTPDEFKEFEKHYNEAATKMIERTNNAGK